MSSKKWKKFLFDDLDKIQQAYTNGDPQILNEFYEPVGYDQYLKKGCDEIVEILQKIPEILSPRGMNYVLN